MLTARLGRPLRVLHIGNIANNAYNNARIQRQYGIDADVICYDYYHIMSCPEWEDASFEGDVDPNFPNWWATSLKGWCRPDWFAQGPANACVQYLRAKQLGLPRLQSVLWVHLQAQSFGVVRYMDKTQGRGMSLFRVKHIAANFIVRIMGLGRIDEPRANFRPVDTRNIKAVSQPKNSHSKFHNLARPVVRSGVGSYYFLKKQMVIAARKSGAAARKILKSAGQILPWIIYAKEISRLQAKVRADDLLERDKTFEIRLQSLEKACSDLPEEVRQTVLNYARDHVRRFFQLMQYYDVIQGYSIDGFIPYMNGLGNFTSYEHGTLRDLPFENSFYGVITRQTYAASPVVFVTNSDVLPATQRMGLEPSRIVCLPHAFDDRKLVSFRNENPHMQPPPGPPVFFSATRHHWIDTSGSWTKGNDVLLRAAGVVAAEGLEFRLVLVEWGKEVAASKALIDQLGIGSKVTWVATMQKRDLWQAYCQAHAVVDQFSLPALGGVGFEVMALGRRLITAIDNGQLEHFFGEAPPCLAASTVYECAAHMRRVIADPNDAAGCGAASAHWMQTCHSAHRIVALQARAYASLLQKV
jgi:hypothetical protein